MNSTTTKSPPNSWLPFTVGAQPPSGWDWTSSQKSTSTMPSNRQRSAMKSGSHPKNATGLSMTLRRRLTSFCTLCSVCQSRSKTLSTWKAFHQRLVSHTELSIWKKKMESSWVRWSKEGWYLSRKAMFHNLLWFMIVTISFGEEAWTPGMNLAVLAEVQEVRVDWLQQDVLLLASDQMLGAVLEFLHNLMVSMDSNHQMQDWEIITKLNMQQLLLEWTLYKLWLAHWVTQSKV